MLATLRGSEAHHHRVGRIGDERRARERHAIELIGNGGHSRIERKRTAVALHTSGVVTGLNQEFAERRETAEAKFWFAVGLIRHIVVKVVAREACRLVEIAIGKRLADFGEHAGCGHIDIPIVGRALCSALVCAASGARSAAPKGFLVERIALHFNGAHHVGTDTAVADGQRLALPLLVGIVGRIACTDWLVGR